MIIEFIRPEQLKEVRTKELIRLEEEKIRGINWQITSAAREGKDRIQLLGHLEEKYVNQLTYAGYKVIHSYSGGSEIHDGSKITLVSW